MIPTQCIKEVVLTSNSLRWPHQVFFSHSLEQISTCEMCHVESMATTVRQVSLFANKLQSKDAHNVNTYIQMAFTTLLLLSRT